MGSSTSKMSRLPAVVIDNGTGYTKMGCRKLRAQLHHPKYNWSSRSSICFWSQELYWRFAHPLPARETLLKIWTFSLETKLLQTVKLMLVRIQSNMVKLKIGL